MPSERPSLATQPFSPRCCTCIFSLSSPPSPPLCLLPALLVLFSCSVCSPLVVPAPWLYLARPHAPLGFCPVFRPVGRPGRPPLTSLQGDSPIILSRRPPLHQFPDSRAGRPVRLNAGHRHGASLRPWEAWTVLTDLCGRSWPVGSPGSSCEAYVGRVCHCHCGGDRCSWHPVRLVWVNGSFGCRTMAARTRDLILHTLPAFTSVYWSHLSVLKESHQLLGNYYRLLGKLQSCGDPDPSVGLRRTAPPLRLSWIPAAMLGCDRAASWFALRRGVKRYPGPHVP